MDKAKYKKLYTQSIEDPEGFWAEQAKSLEWIKPFTTVKNASFSDDISIKWFEDGMLNVSANCIDRHLPHKGNDTAIIWEAEEPGDPEDPENKPGESKHITYNALHTEVCRMANVIKDMGIKKGDRVIIYMPMIPEAAYAMLACTRIGAVHSVVFGGFSPKALAGRIEDSKARLIITADEGKRGGKRVPLKGNVDEAIQILESNSMDVSQLPAGMSQEEIDSLNSNSIEKILVVKHTGGTIGWQDGRDIWYHDAVGKVSDVCEPEPMGAEDPLFILYTSGSTGKPKGVLHTTAGYLLYASLTHKYVFDYKDGQIYWCTADVGWITGHSYILYGPLANGAVTLMFEGIPTYPDPSRFWQVIDKHKVNIFYTAPTAIRSLLREGNEWLMGLSLDSLQVLGSVGEPINPEAWLWYHESIGRGHCPIVDTWWQTETGGIMITPLPGAVDLKPGSATLPFFGVQPVILDESGKELSGTTNGYLCIKESWPGQLRSIYGDHNRFKENYFSRFPGYYFSGDGARRDEDGYFWITGRVDDVLNVSGHRLGTAEIESALNAHDKIAESAVVGYPHDIKGEGIYAFVTLYKGQEPSEELKKDLIAWIRKEISPIASPDFIQWASGLPKTRSGKIMRRILRKIAANDYQDLGDTNTLTNPEIVEELIANRLNRW